MMIAQTFTPKSRSAWRNWFVKNNDKKTEIWLVFFKKHTGKTTIHYDEAIEEALCFGWIDSTEKRIDEERYALRFAPRKKSSNWSEINIKRYQKMFEQALVFPSGEKAFEQRN